MCSAWFILIWTCGAWWRAIPISCALMKKRTALCLYLLRFAYDACLCFVRACVHDLSDIVHLCMFRPVCAYIQCVYCACVSVSMRVRIGADRGFSPARVPKHYRSDGGRGHGGVPRVYLHAGGVLHRGRGQVDWAGGGGGGRYTLITNGGLLHLKEAWTRLKCSTHSKLACTHTAQTCMRTYSFA